MARRLKYPEFVGTHLPTELYQRLEAEAVEQERALSDIIRRSLYHYFESIDNEEVIHWGGKYD